jgi:hypothetical protein
MVFYYFYLITNYVYVLVCLIIEGCKLKVYVSLFEVAHGLEWLIWKFEMVVIKRFNLFCFAFDFA